MRPPVSPLTGLIALVVVLALSACAPSPQPVVTRLPSDNAASPTDAPMPTGSAAPRPSGSATAGAPSSDTTDCAGGETTLAGSSQAFIVTGDCPILRIEGNGVTVDASNASVGTVMISGDRIGLDAAVIGDVTVQGSDCSVETSSARSVALRGDRNTFSGPGGSERVVISGNDNVVTASASSVSVDGQGNRVS